MRIIKLISSIWWTPFAIFITAATGYLWLNSAYYRCLQAMAFTVAIIFLVVNVQCVSLARRKPLGYRKIAIKLLDEWVYGKQSALLTSLFIARGSSTCWLAHYKRRIWVLVFSNLPLRVRWTTVWCSELDRRVRSAHVRVFCCPYPFGGLAVQFRNERLFLGLGRQVAAIPFVRESASDHEILHFLQDIFYHILAKDNDMGSLMRLFYESQALLLGSPLLLTALSLLAMLFCSAR